MNYQNASDRELWQLVRDDDMAAYRELFRRYAPKLFKQVAGYIKDRMAAEELVMDLLFNIWQKRHDPIMQGEVAPYLFKSMRNEVLMHLRKNIPETLPIEGLHENFFIEYRKADHDLTVSDNERIYKKCLLLLSPQRREAFRLSREQNLSYAEIAREMNLSVSTVENYIAAALKTFRKSMLENSAGLTYLLLIGLLFL